MPKEEQRAGILSSEVPTIRSSGETYKKMG
jgi:hypothetical protein